MGCARPTRPRQFGNWVVTERLSGHEASGGADDVAEYRARNALVPSSETVLLRVYRADPFLPEPDARRSGRRSQTHTTS